MRRMCVPALAALALLVPAARIGAATTPNGTEYHVLTFPVQEHVTYYDDFGGVRNHPGNDLMGAKLDHELAANDGTITFVRGDSSGHSGNMLILTGTDGWKYWYLHINNDDPGTDDGKNPAQWRFAPGIGLGSHVKAGQFIAYMGDSGEAETTDPHLHFELHRPDDSYIDPYTSLRLAQGQSANGLCNFPNVPTPAPNTSAGHGYWTLGADGTVLTFGTAQNYGRPPSAPAGDPYVTLVRTHDAKGYWILDAAGNVRPFGSARQYGGMGGKHLNAPMIGMTATPTDKGYWLLARDGGIFSYGDAAFYGSMGGKRLNAPIIAMASSIGGHGYWLLGSDGGIFGYGDAKFYGSTGSMHLTVPVDGMVASPTGLGYWILAADGSVYHYGDAHYVGSIPRLGWCPGTAALSMAVTTTARGYWLLMSTGVVVAFGDAKNYGQPAMTRARAISIAVSP